MEIAALIIGYSFMAGAAVAAALGGLYAVITWWEWKVLAKNYKFDGRGNIVQK